MKNVGEFDKRNAEYDLKFNRDEIIKKIVSSSSPVIFDVGAHHGQSGWRQTRLCEKPQTGQ